MFPVRDRLLRKMLFARDFLPHQTKLRHAEQYRESAVHYRVLLIHNTAVSSCMGEGSLSGMLCSAVGKAPAVFILQHPIPLEDGSVVIVLAHERDDRTVLRKTQSFLDYLPKTWSYTAILSTASERIAGLHQIYQQAKTFAIYALFDTTEHPFVSVDVKLRQFDASRAYPLQLEWRIYDSICNAKFGLAEQDFTSLLHSLRNFPPEKLERSISHLLFSINAALAAYCREPADEAGAESGPTSFFLSESSIPRLQKELHSIFNELSAEQCNSQSPRTSAFVESVDQILQSQFCDNRMSLNLLADKLDLTPNYVGRAYKRAAGISIPEKIMAMRMAKARELLKATRMPISQIASHTGFTGEGYFYKAFKQNHGCTPTDYRKAYRQAQANTCMVSNGSS